MDSYVAVVFDSDPAAIGALHALWQLDASAAITVHGAAVIRRDAHGHIDVATKRTDPGVRTAVGIAVGVVLGALAGPVGVGVGAAAGALAGVTADNVKAGEHEEAVHESGVVMEAGQSAVIAEVSEVTTGPLDAEMQRLGGRVFRRGKVAVRNRSFWGANYVDDLFPYDYDPKFG
jgi:uncharacterized membrane protein